MNNRVTLPPGHLIEYHSLCEAIAEAVYPLRGQGLEGVDCIVGKVVKHQVPMAQSIASQGWPSQAGFEPALLTPDGQTLDQLLVSEQPGTREHVALELPFADATHPAVVEFSLPYQLDDGDRRALEALLPQLPPLRYPMDEDAAAAFLSAYIKLPSRPVWEPVLMTEADVVEQRARQEQHFDKVLQSLRDEFAAGRLQACTQSGLPVKAMSLRCFIPRQSAIDYLDRCGLVHDGSVSHDTTGQRSVPERVASAVTKEAVLISEQGLEIPQPQGDPAANEFSPELGGRAERCTQQPKKPTPSDAGSVAGIPNAADTTSKPSREGAASTVHPKGKEWTDAELMGLFHYYEQHGAAAAREQYGIKKTRLYDLIAKYEEKAGVKSKRKKKVRAKKSGVKSWLGL